MIKRKIKMGVQGDKDGAEGGEEFFGSEAEMPGGGGEKDEGPVEAGDEQGEGVQEFALAGRQGENGGDGVHGPGADLDGVIEAELGDFEIQAEGAAEGAANFGPVEFPGNAFSRQDGVGAAGWGIALAEAVEGAVVLGNDFMETTTFPGAGNELGGFGGFGPEEKGGEGFQVGAELMAPSGVEGGTARDGFEGGPEVSG